jgi:hypothetical protein
MTIMGFDSHDFTTNCRANVSTTLFSKNIGLGKQAHDTVVSSWEVALRTTETGSRGLHLLNGAPVTGAQFLASLVHVSDKSMLIANHPPSIPAPNGSPTFRCKPIVWMHKSVRVKCRYAFALDTSQWPQITKTDVSADDKYAPTSSRPQFVRYI